MSVIEFKDITEAPAPLETIMEFLKNKRAGVAIDFINMKMVVRDPDTPANEFYGDPNNHGV